MIKVLDALCGSGKSSGMLKHITNEYNKDKSINWLYITPYLNEVEVRVPEECPDLGWVNPVNYGEGKLESLHKLISSKKNIVSTHSLFHMFTLDTVDLLLSNNYRLVIDEAVSSMGVLQGFNTSDIEALLVSGMVYIDEEDRGKISWNEEQYGMHDGKYKDIRTMCGLETLYLYNGMFLMWEYPPKLLAGCSECFVLTYKFEGSSMCNWLQIQNLPYEYIPHEVFGLKPHTYLMDIVRDNLTIVNNRNLNTLQKRSKSGCLSSTWFNNASKETLNTYKKFMVGTVVNTKSKVGDVFWTTFKDYRSKLQGRGYTKGISEDQEAFLSWTTRATNNYKDYTLCMYAVNIYKNPIEVRYAEGLGAEVDQDSYALGEMIQFLFRGAIRQGKPMKVLILSGRMRKLLEEWLLNG